MATAERDQLRQWAMRGAEQRLREIATETEAIYRAFPKLRDGPNGAKRIVPASGDAKADSAERLGHRGRHMRSAGARKAARERMLKYWAAKRRASANGASTTAKPAVANAGRTRGGRKMSPAARKRISEAQKARWAARRKAQKSG